MRRLVLAAFVALLPATAFGQHEHGGGGKESGGSGGGGGGGGGGGASSSPALAAVTGEAPSDFPFGGNIVFEQAVGEGTLVASGNERSPFFGWSLDMQPEYRFTPVWVLSGRFILSQELTSSYKTADTQKHQLIPSDSYLTMWGRNVVKDPVTGIQLTPYLTAVFPTSILSRKTTNLLFAIRPGLQFTRLFWDRLSLLYEFRATKYFNEYTTMTVNTEDEGNISLVRQHGNEDLGSGFVSTGMSNVSFAFYNRLGATVIITDELSFSLLWAVSSAFTYETYPKDELAAEEAKGGRGQRDVMYGWAEIGYAFTPNYSVSLGTYTEQPPKTADNSGFRFPWWDFYSEADNLTQVYLDLAGSF